jgi:hypothetical protein
MSQGFNPYGDKMVSTTGFHGVDIASQRVDDLDKKALEFAATDCQVNGYAVDLGCGGGAQGLRFARLGIPTLCIDILPIDSTKIKEDGIDRGLPIEYLQKDAKNIFSTDLPENIRLFYSQRFVHYLKFLEAVALLKIFRSRMVDEGKLYLSASGLDSELAIDYLGRSSLIEERFFPLGPAMAEKHQIHEPVCLYTAEELAYLCELASFDVEEVWVSDFGNIKGVFRPKQA